MQLSIFARQLRLIETLAGSSYVSAEAICDKLGITRRTLFRYLDLFRTNGFLVERNRDGYRLSAASPFLLKVSERVHFSREEAEALLDVLDAKEQRSSELEHLRDKLARLTDRRLLDAVKVDERYAQVFRNLYEAIRQHEIVVIRNYRSLRSDTITDRTVEPYCFVDGNESVRCYEIPTDTNKTFTISFLMDGTYATNLSFKVLSIAPLAPPTVTAGPVEWDAFGLAWDPQYRAAGYAVRVWTDCPNPGATATRVEESFAGWPKSKPAGWSYHNMSSGYKDAAAPVSFDATGDELKTYDLGGPISSVSFRVIGHSISGSTSTLTVVGIAADGTETTLGALTVAEIGTTTAGIDQTYTIAEGLDIRRIAWRYTKDGNTGGNVGVGSVAIEGTGFSTPRWLPGWGPAAKEVGLVQDCTVKKPRPGKALGVDPADKTKDLEAPRINFAEVTVRDAAGATLATVVAVEVPAPPRSARATLMILK